MSEAVEAARRIVAWDDAGRLADDEWLVERNESAIIAIARALLSTSTALREMREKVIPFDATDLAQLQQVREELRNRWRASAWKLLCRVLDDLESRAAIEKATKP